jgi:hypothetical protein
MSRGVHSRSAYERRNKCAQTYRDKWWSTMNPSQEKAPRRGGSTAGPVGRGNGVEPCANRDVRPASTAPAWHRPHSARRLRDVEDQLQTFHGSSYSAQRRRARLLRHLLFSQRRSRRRESPLRAPAPGSCRLLGSADQPRAVRFCKEARNRQRPPLRDCGTAVVTGAKLRSSASRTGVGSWQRR